jgi:hypothetical protein
MESGRPIQHPLELKERTPEEDELLKQIRIAAGKKAAETRRLKKL